MLGGSMGLFRDVRRELLGVVERGTKTCKHTVGGKNTHPLQGPLKGYVIIGIASLFCLEKTRIQKHRLLAFPMVTEALGSSRQLVGIISTYPGTSPAPW